MVNWKFWKTRKSNMRNSLSPTHSIKSPQTRRLSPTHRLSNANNNKNSNYKKFSSALSSEKNWSRKIPLYRIQTDKTKLRAFLRAVQRYNKYDCGKYEIQNKGIKKLCDSDLKKIKYLEESLNIKKFFKESKDKYYLIDTEIEPFKRYLIATGLHTSKNIDKVLISMVDIDKHPISQLLHVKEDNAYDNLTSGDEDIQNYLQNEKRQSQRQTLHANSQSRKTLYKEHGRNPESSRGLFSRNPKSKHRREPISHWADKNTIDTIRV